MYKVGLRAQHRNTHQIKKKEQRNINNKDTCRNIVREKINLTRLRFLVNLRWS